MNTTNLKTVKEKINQIGFGIMKISGSSMWSMPGSFMIDTFEITDEGHLWCTTVDAPPEEMTRIKNQRVKLKYVQKSSGLFIRIVGHIAHIDHVASNPGNADQRIIMVKVEEVNCFQKQTISPSTSFLQLVSNFTMSRVLAGRGI